MLALSPPTPYGFDYVSVRHLQCGWQPVRAALCVVKGWLFVAVQVTVLRDGQVQDMSVFDLLVGDVMLFETGDILPADAIIIAGNTIR